MFQLDEKYARYLNLKISAARELPGVPSTVLRLAVWPDINTALPT
jgi:hypothetical protein